MIVLLLLVTAAAAIWAVGQVREGTCGSESLASLRQARAQMLTDHPPVESTLFECADAGDEIYVAAETTQAYDCAALEAGLARFYRSPVGQPTARDEAVVDRVGPYVDSATARIYLSCDDKMFYLTRTDLSGVT